MKSSSKTSNELLGGVTALCILALSVAGDAGRNFEELSENFRQFSKLAIEIFFKCRVFPGVIGLY